MISDNPASNSSVRISSSYCILISVGTINFRKINASRRGMGVSCAVQVLFTIESSRRRIGGRDRELSCATTQIENIRHFK
jgi:hypothetical protein